LTTLADTNILIGYVVAATASVLGAELLTLNIGDFPMFPRLRAPY